MERCKWVTTERRQNCIGFAQKKSNINKIQKKNCLENVLCNKQGNCHSFHTTSSNLAFGIYTDEHSNNNIIKFIRNSSAKTFWIELSMSCEITVVYSKNYQFFQCERMTEGKMNNNQRCGKSDDTSSYLIHLLLNLLCAFWFDARSTDKLNETRANSIELNCCPWFKQK